MAKRIVMVTGASRGIGKAIAVKFAKKGYDVAINCIRNEERLMQAKRRSKGIRRTASRMWEIWETAAAAGNFIKW